MTPSGRRPTMRDVAARAGVSFKTVSRVINNESGVSDHLAARVRVAIVDLGYTRDDRASNLRSATRTTQTIGFVQIDVANPFFSSVFRGLEDVARERNFMVLAGSSDGDPVRESELIATFMSRRVDGLVVVPSPSTVDLLRAEMHRGTSVVCVDLFPDGLDCDVVLTDHVLGARRATQHLIDHGHERIAFLGDDIDLYRSALEREQGYREALQANGLPVDDELVRTGVGSPAAAETGVHRLLDLVDPPTALFTGQNFVTMGAVRALHQRGRQTDIAQIGFDDVELADVVEPGITVVPQDPRRLGQLAGHRLFARLDGDTSPAVVERLTPGIVERGSGEIRPGPSSG